METAAARINLIGVRLFQPEEDRAFVFATWLRGLRFGNDWFRAIDSDVYFKVYHAIIEAIIKRPTVQIRVACLKDDPSVILGYSVLEGDTLHFVFCKKAWRGIGIAKGLVPSNIRSVSHLTEVGKGILAKHKGVIFNPFI